MNFSLNKEKKELFIKTSIWNSIVEVFKDEKNIDISDFLVSIQLKDNIVLVKTSKTILKHECLVLSDTIFEKFVNKVSKMGIETKDLEIKYI